MRPLEEHLSPEELRQLMSSRTGGIEREDSAALRDHVAHCPQCTQIAAILKRLASERSDGQSDEQRTEHISEEDLYRLAGGIVPAAEAQPLLRHASDCNECGRVLLQAIEDLGIEEGTAAPIDMRDLKSSSADWQRSLARELAGLSAVTPPAPRLLQFKRRRWFGLPAYGALAGVFLLAVGVIGVRQYRSNTDNALLAAAYNQQRLTDLRLTSGDPVPMASQLRGDSDNKVPVPLLNLKARVRQHLDENANDAYWQQMLGRIALVQNDGEKALQEFNLLSITAPNTPGLKADLAAAHFQVGYIRSDPDEYARAADLYHQVIDETSSPAEKAAAYFNRGLCWERLSIDQKAIRDYESAMSLEKNQAWSKEIKRRLDFLKLKTQLRGNDDQGSDLSPSTFTKSINLGSHAPQDDYEMYLHQASREWLGQRSLPATQSALQQLAIIGLRHQDAWLTDFLRQPQTKASQIATDELTSGVRANDLGEADLALASLLKASSLFAQAHNSPGQLRARVELVYTQQRMGRAEQCLKAAHTIQQDPHLQRYAWLHSYLLLELAACESAHGDFSVVSRNVTEVINLAHATGLPVQALRAEGFLVESLNALGQSKAAWQLAQQGLEESIQTRGAAMRTYQFLFSIYDAMQAEGLTEAAADVAGAASKVSTRVPNLQIRGYAQEVLGRAETAAGHTALANQAFHSASDILHSMPSGDANRLYTADWETDRSMLLAGEGQLPAALQRMQQADVEIAATDNYDVRQRHYTQFASLLLRAGKPGEALDRALSATQDAEGALFAATNESQKLSWDRANGNGYRMLVECLTEMGRPEEALRAWEWYRSAPYRSASRIANFREATFSPPQIPEDRRRNLTLVIARLDSVYVAWSITNAPDVPIRMVKVSATPAHISEMALTFKELCANRDSSRTDIALMGDRLYRELLAPFEDQINKTNILFLDLDVNLQAVPIAALTRPSHRYLNDTHALVFLPRWWTIRPPSPDTISSSASALLVEGSASLPRGASTPPVSLAAEYLESKEVAAHFPHAVLLRQQQSSTALLQRLLPQAEVFHFSGHTFTFGGQTGLLLKYPDIVFAASSLQGVSLHRCRLAVLATCTSVGKSPYGVDDTSNLAHALLTAGASNVVATIWDVDSQASHTIMLSFYDSLAQSVPIAVALHDAQQKLRSTPATNHPFFWSSLQVYSQ